MHAETRHCQPWRAVCVAFLCIGLLAASLTTTSLADAQLAGPVSESFSLCNSGNELPYRGDILPYLQSANDETVPPGRYSLGALNDFGVNHRIDLDREAWVTVRAEVPGTVVVDGSLNNAGVTFAGEGFGSAKRSQRLVLAGVHFIATSVMFESTQDVVLWYTCHRYTPREWHQNAMAAAERANVEVPADGPKDPHGDGGGLYAIPASDARWQSIAKQMGAFLPTGLRGGTTAAGASRNLRFFGVDVGPVADDGIYMGGTWNFVVQGARVHSVSELYPQRDGDAISVDPGPVFGNEPDQFHNDGIQIGRAGYQPLVLDSWISNRIMFNKFPTPARDDWQLVVRRSWFGAEPTVDTGGADQVAARSDDPDFDDWAEGNSGGPWRSEPIAIIATDHGNTPEQMAAEFSDITHIAHAGPLFKYVVPSIPGADASDFANLDLRDIRTEDLGLGNQDIFTNVATLASHPDNPANAWRQANPYESLATNPAVTASTYEDPGTPIVEALLGDVNCDNRVDLGDAMMVAQFTVSARTDSGGCQLTNPTNELNVARADVNEDGIVSLTDAVLIARCSVGVAVGFCQR